ncbi:MAG: ATP-binding protein [Methanobacteriota archaeon]|nr:MAG: ATP-binding protein [Euryarchaeota archaeon]
MMEEKTETESATFPKEVLKFLASSGGHSLILRGMAGTGKTTLALQMIEELAQLQQSYYMSTRVSDHSLFNQFPWLMDKVKEGEILKARKKLRTKADAEMQVEKILLGLAAIKGEMQGEKAKAPRTELLKLEGSIESGEDEDSPAEPTGENEITVTVGSMMPEIEMAYDVVDKALPERTLIIIDSIDALADKYGVPPARLITALQKDLVEGCGTNVVYVLETPDPLLDYLGDGVLYLSLDSSAGRRIREMDLLKLRGCEIRQPKYVYTLLGGRVRTFEYSRYSKPEQPKPFEPVMPINDKYLSTGNPDLDDMLEGGLRKGTIALIELSPGVPVASSAQIEHAVICNFASQGHGVAWMPTKKTGADTAREELLGFLPPDVFDRNVRILEPHAASESPRNYTMTLEGENVKVDMKWQDLQYALRDTKQPFLASIGFDSLESIYGPGVLDGLMDFLTSLLNNDGILLGTVTPSVRSTNRLADLAHTHIRLDKISGVTMVRGEEPFTAPYAMVQPEPGDFRPKLVPIL